MMTNEEFERAQEEEIREKIQAYAIYQGDIERTTIDKEWTESELKDETWSYVNKALNGDENLANKYSKRALLDRELLKTEYLTNSILDNNDLIEVYNKEYDKHHNDKDRKFGIYYFEQKIYSIIRKVLKNNLLAK